ncbi:leucine-rich repeat domain-containing protein [Posidoniimonas polymericola]|uniref:leucine-rich repeat domain-containing protein n=1 Tax=Posidoniimonas polymericola TaxID=2528002 RepID=UPI0011B3E85B|nr:hypothetical protein [Posidoniimonas polymericola]
MAKEPDENAGDDINERLLQWVREIEARYPDTDDDPPPVRVKGGVDAEIVEYLLALEEKTDFSPIFKTDEAGRVIDVGIGVLSGDGMAIKEILERVEPLRSVASAEVYEVGSEPLENPFKDADLLYLAGWTKLTRLKVSVSKVSGHAMVNLTCQNKLEDLVRLSYGRHTTDADLVLASVAHCQNLREIDLRLTDLTDDGVRRLAQLTKLEKLDFSNTSVSGEGFADAQYALALRDLNLEKCPITDRGLKQIGQFVNLEQFYAGGNCKKVTDSGINYLTQLERLKTVSICGASITARSTASLERLNHLKTLWIENTPLGDEVVPNLSRLVSLERLWAKGTKISNDGFKRLQQVLPRCELIRD